ncbi:MAG: GNAT family N-acetyltransferase [Proteobacteria bacterium]|nr:GNAT family N-acetyltransferase [Pseudomonadota bacterium]
MDIQRSAAADISVFREFWDRALRYQEAQHLPLWPVFPEDIISSEIDAGLHYSAYFPNGVLAGYFSVALSDAHIWGELERGDAIYIHRMCVNPERKGGGLSAAVLAWAHGFASNIGRASIRMDTWADNRQLVDYYIRCGFRHIGDRQLGDVPELPPHYSGTSLALFENAVAPTAAVTRA